MDSARPARGADRSRRLRRARRGDRPSSPPIQRHPVAGPVRCSSCSTWTSPEFAKIATELIRQCRLLEVAPPDGQHLDDSPEIKAAERRSLEASTRLDPSDAVMLLRRLLSTSEANQTAEEKVAAYETLLEPASIEVLGDALAARLAFSLAQLWSRIGDFNEFAVRLAQAVELDPHYPAATAMAAGYFAVPEDPFSEVELLVVALMANPLDLGFASRLGLISLEEGAYQSALRVSRWRGNRLPDHGVPGQRTGPFDRAVGLRPSAVRLLDQFQRTLDSGPTPSRTTTSSTRGTREYQPGPC